MSCSEKHSVALSSYLTGPSEKVLQVLKLEMLLVVHGNTVLTGQDSELNQSRCFGPGLCLPS